MKLTTILAALLLTALLATGTQASPPFTNKELVHCFYCHTDQLKLNYRGNYYKLHNLTFAEFDDAAEAKKAGVPIAPLAETRPKSLTPPKSQTPPKKVDPPKPNTPVYPGPGRRVFGDGPDGVVQDGNPVASGWTSLFNGKNSGILVNWNMEKSYWDSDPVDGAIVGTTFRGTPHNHYLFSNMDYSDFEMHVDVKLVGHNSGVCARIQPRSFDDVPGYQVDMGVGSWGCLWDENRRQRKILDCPMDLQNKLVKQGDWNHYYFKMVGSHITIYLNGVKTAEGDDPGGFKSGPIAFQLSRGPGMVASFKNIYIKPLAKPTRGTAPKSDMNPRQ
ncbi:MAG: DUF1080 domain-containing protein [Armatimonas sp.]